MTAGLSQQNAGGHFADRGCCGALKLILIICRRPARLKSHKV